MPARCIYANGASYGLSSRHRTTKLKRPGKSFHLSVDEMQLAGLELVQANAHGGHGANRSQFTKGGGVIQW